jgi:hypothetical protein
MDNEWKLEEKLEQMESKPNSQLDVIATFIREKPVKIENGAQLTAVIKRYAKVAKQIAGVYSPQAIFKAFEELKKSNEIARRQGREELDYTLETIFKKLTK